MLNFNLWLPQICKPRVQKEILGGKGGEREEKRERENNRLRGNCKRLVQV